MQYNFEWDPQKAEANRKKHGVSFDHAATMFNDPRMLTLFDSQHSDSEDRWISMGLASSGKLIVVCHTFVEENENVTKIRIISSRKATKQESKQYQDG